MKKRILALLATLAVASALAGGSPPPPPAEVVTSPHGLPAKWKKFELCTGFKKVGVK